MGAGGDLIAEAERKRAERLAEAEKQARETGKEPFDLARLEQLMNRGDLAGRASQLRAAYYLLHPELKTLAELAKIMIDGEPWEDAP
jgi:vacuolar-type H+-ATPase subunit H